MTSIGTRIFKYRIVPWALGLSTLLLLIVTGCSSGVSQEEFDRVSNDLQSVQADLEAAQTQITTLTTDRDQRQGELDGARDEVSTLAAELEELQGDVAAAKEKQEQGLGT